MEKGLAGGLCTILVNALSSIIFLNKGNLSSVANILKVLNRK